MKLFRGKTGHISLILSSMCFLSAYFEAQALSLTEKCMQDASQSLPTLLEVGKFQGQPSVVSWAMNEKSAQLGSEVQIVRCLPPGKYVTLATALVKRLNGAVVEASISPYSALNFGKSEQNSLENMVAQANTAFAPMVGDLVLENTPTVTNVPKPTPLVRLSIADLFERNSNEVVLSPGGKQKLTLAMQEFKNTSGTLQIEVRLNVLGNRENLQATSDKQAFEIAQFVRAKFGEKEDGKNGFASENLKVHWIGFGSNALADSMQKIEQYGDEFVTLRVRLE